MTASAPLRRLCQAAAGGRIDDAQAALNEGARVNGRAAHGQTPLMFAAAHSQTPMMVFLRYQGARMDMLDEEGSPAMFYALRPLPGKNRNEMFQALRTVLLLGANPGAYDEDRVPLVHHLPRLFSFEQIRELTHLNVPLASVCERLGRTVLHAMTHYPASRDQPQDAVIRLALDNSVAIDARDHNGATALALALRENASAFVRTLWEHGADPQRLSDPADRQAWQAWHDQHDQHDRAPSGHRAGLYGVPVLARPNGTVDPFAAAALPVSAAGRAVPHPDMTDVEASQASQGSAVPAPRLQRRSSP